MRANVAILTGWRLQGSRPDTFQVGGFGYSELPSKRFIRMRPLRMQRMQA